MQTTVVSNIIELIQLVSPGGEPDPAIPTGMAALLLTLVHGGEKVLVVKGKNAWLVVLQPRVKDNGCAAGHLYQMDAQKDWDATTLIIYPDLKCITISGEKLENLDKLEGVSSVISSWMQNPI